ncbi:Hcp family type VI secretion system effector [Aquabacterium sp. UBA2148]|uniref:Hcp family type VI secretion system effector n=1 Tax=Aquabacterium sp. UBA2148 TaxID=1946042 RepID=UPI00257B6225|nr:type VI secretion system tube protein Hcp [Aquabacterium sp. UBA2148]
MKDIYVKFGKALNGKEIKGESRDAGGTEKHGAPWFEVVSWSHLIRQPKSATASTAGGHTAERCEHGEMIFTKDLDLVSPQLWEACSAGSLYDDVEIHFMRANGVSERVLYLKIKLKKVLISQVVPQVMSEGLPTETFGLRYSAVEWTYTQQTMDGKSKPGNVAAWSLATNKAAFDAPN